MKCEGVVMMKKKGSVKRGIAKTAEESKKKFWSNIPIGANS